MSDTPPREYIDRVLEHASDYVMVVDEAHTVEYVSPAVERVIGSTPGELHGADVLEFVHPDDRERVRDAFSRLDRERAEATRERAETTIEYRARDGDGSWVWLDVRCRNLLDDPDVEGVVATVRDVTDRKERERELTELEETVNTALKNVPLIFFSFDEDGVLTRSEGQALERIGLESGEAVGRSVFEVFADHPKIPADCERALDGEQVTSIIEFAGVVLETWYQPLLEDGEVVGVVGHSYDVTDRIERERELERHRDILEQTQSAADIGVFEFEVATGTLTWVSDYTAPFLDDEDELETFAATLEYIHPADREHVRNIVQEAIESRDRYDVEYRLVGDDDQRWYRTVGKPHETDEGTVVRGLFQDINDRKEREQKLERAETVIEAAGDMIYALDDGGRFTYVNDAITDVTGYSEDELRGSPLSMIVDEDAAEHGDELVRTLRSSSGRRGTFELELVTADGGRITCENHVALLSFEGEFRGTAGVIRDITDRKHREQQIRVFNRILRHNIRNKVAIVRTRVGQLATRGGSDGPTVDEAITALEELQDLTGNVQKLNRAMTMETDRKEVEIAAYLSHLVRLCDREYSDATVTLERSGTGVLWVLPNLELALYELLENAAKHSGSAPVVDVSVDVSGEAVRVRVSDDGPGLSEEKQEILTDGAEAPLIHASGLGLWMVYWVVNSHGGSLDVAASDDGTAVTVTLPQATAETTVSAESVSELELQEARDRFQTIFAETFSALVIVDDEGRYIEGNQASRELFGLGERELLGRRLDEFTSGAVDFEGVVADARQRGDELELEELTLVQPDGNERIVESSIATDVSPDQHLFVLHDVTERKERADELDRQKEKFRVLHDVAVELESCDTTDVVFETLVTAARDILDFDVAIVEVVEDGMLVPQERTETTPVRGYADATPVDARDRLAAAVYRRGETEIVDDMVAWDGEPAEPYYRSRLAIPVGEYGVFQAAGVEPGTFDDGDRDLAELLVAHVREALARLRRERQLTDRTAELERQNERLDGFAAVVSHDLRNPLNVATKQLELAEGEVQNAHLSNVGDALQRMDELVGDVLALARAGRELGEVEWLELDHTVMASWTNVETGKATVSSEAGLLVRADPSRLRQLLENLFRNAVEHGSTSPGSQARQDDGSENACESSVADAPEDAVEYGGREVSVTVGDLEEDDGFFVADDGVGVPEDERDEIFASGYSTRDDGTGFGLSIVRDIVDAHGWEIHVTESAAGGARFEVAGVECQ